MSRWCCVSCVLLWVACRSFGAELPGRPAPEWDALFQRTSGWIGADGNYSVPLGKQTTLWLFSDTFVGKVKDGRRLDASMINNSVALQQGTNAPEFFYRTTADGKPASFLRPEHEDGYFWLTHGIRDSRGLFFFMVRVVTVQNGSPFGFKVTDGWLAHVADPDTPPLQWRITQTRVPFTRIAADGALIFGGSVFRDGKHVYVFGTDSRAGAKPNSLVVARVLSNAVDDFRQWRFWSKGSWQEDGQQVAPLFPNLGSEFSISRVPGRKQYAAVYSEGIGGKIVLRTAPSLTGPWGEPVTLYQCPEMQWAAKAFCYAAKAHPELTAAQDELLLTYAANAWNFADLFKEPRLYWPRFVRVKLPPD